MRKSRTREFILAGFFIGMGIVLPSIFHLSGINGKIFLPMHIAALISGFFISPVLAFLVGFLTPYLNSMVTGMPPMFPMAAIMSVEIGLYALSIAILSGKMKLNKITSLILSMIIGRIGGGVMVYILASNFGVKMNPILFIKGSIVAGLPGIIIQIILIPIIVSALEKYNQNKSVKFGY